MLIRLSNGIVGVAALLLAALFCFQVQAQSYAGCLRGKVLDPAGAPIAGARIGAVLDGRVSGGSTTSDQAGEFSLLLEPGRYAITVIADGFEEASGTLDIIKSRTEYYSVILQVAGQRDTVTVVGTDYRTSTISTATKTLSPLRDVPQSITVVTQEQIRDQLLSSLGDVVRYVPGVTAHQGENNRDQIVIRGVSSSADFFLNGVRDDVQYYRDLYNLDRIEVLRGPNAMIFGRGGGGGIVNRVTKEAGFTRYREIALQGGSYGNKRLEMDFDQPLNSKVAFRANGVYENSESFRRFFDLERYGVNPTLAFAPGTQTRITFGYEYFRDYRTADRGIPSFQGRPSDTEVSTFFGDPDNSYARVSVNLGWVAIEHQAGGLNIRNRTLLGAYDRSYQNYVPGAVTPDKTQVSLSAYNNATQRLNIFNQTDLTYSLSTRRIRHTLLFGAEVGGQLTDNFRNTGFFSNTITSIRVPYASPTIHTPVTFRQSATDADNYLTARISAGYAQDQIDLCRYIQVVAGLRYDHFDLEFHNDRNGQDLDRIDNLVSPRIGIVFKPVNRLSIYGSYSVAYLPSSGDQFSSLTTVTQQVKPERFNNHEFGVKWDIHRSLSLTAALYRLDRVNTRATDPKDPTRILQTGSQRSNGYEFGVSGGITRSWTIAGGYAYQDAFITSATTAAGVGAQVAQVPHHNFSLWNNYQIVSRLAAGVGVVRRSDMFAAIDDTVTLPGYTRADAAVYFSLTERVRLQANIENLFDKRYYINADGNNNISPGSPRLFRVGLTARF
ncbi:MAG TPA: TonB-dependent siderophore receptor [Blastocatellia bacterium]|nr:TonB-dependent siderophore receptor [Blastocatellia bacterium]